MNLQLSPPERPPGCPATDPRGAGRFNAAQERTGVVYISRIPPAMRPTKVQAPFEPARGDWSSLFTTRGYVFLIHVNHTDSLTCGRIDPKSAYLRRKHTSTKKAHYTEGWVEFKDKRVARLLLRCSMLNQLEARKGRDGTTMSGQ